MTKLTGSLGVRNEINVDIIGTGARGKEGKSAYEIWLDLGNEGTEQEYLASLKGQDGYTPVKDVDYFDGEKGEKGEQGPKGDKGDGLEFNWNGTQLGIRVEGEASYQYVNLKGAKGDTGSKGESGDDGRGIVSIARTSGTGAAGTTDTYTITFTDSTTATFQVYNGADGVKGDKGDDGHTPIKGTDYWTTADQASIVADVLAALPDGDGVGY